MATVQPVAPAVNETAPPSVRTDLAHDFEARFSAWDRRHDEKYPVTKANFDALPPDVQAARLARLRRWFAYQTSNAQRDVCEIVDAAYDLQGMMVEFLRNYNPAEGVRVLAEIGLEPPSGEPDPLLPDLREDLPETKFADIHRAIDATEFTLETLLSYDIDRCDSLLEDPADPAAEAFVEVLHQTASYIEAFCKRFAKDKKRHDARSIATEYACFPWLTRHLAEMIVPGRSETPAATIARNPDEVQAIADLCAHGQRCHEAASKFLKRGDLSESIRNAALSVQWAMLAGPAGLQSGILNSDLDDARARLDTVLATA